MVTENTFSEKNLFVHPIFNSHHHAITGSQETVQLVMSNLFENNLLTLLKTSTKTEALHYTSVGTQKTTCLKSVAIH
jgi:hypothetical protein